MTNRGSHDFDQGLSSLSGGSNFQQCCERVDADLPIYFVREMNRAVLDHRQDRSEIFYAFSRISGNQQKIGELRRSIKQSDRTYPR